jgi:hypothetical protein
MDLSAARYRLGVDVGGTHTDLVLLDVTSGALMVEKVASTPKNPALGVLDGVARFIIRGSIPDRSSSSPRHDTRQCALELRGAVGLITKGFAPQEVQTGARRQLFTFCRRSRSPAKPDKGIPERSDWATCSSRSIAMRCAAPRAS